MTDPENNVLTYSLSCPEFTYTTATEIISFASNYDMDLTGTASSVTCAVTVSDGISTTTANLTVNVKNINDNTPSLDQPYYTYIVDANTAVGATVGTITATDGDASPYGRWPILDSCSLRQELLVIRIMSSLAVMIKMLSNTFDWKKSLLLLCIQVTQMYTDEKEKWQKPYTIRK